MAVSFYLWKWLLCLAGVCLTITGRLGDVMQELARAALSFARSRAKELNIDLESLEKADLHIHLPEGAIPKDGPSAGITMATALISAITRRPVRSDVCMTGEITLTGRVLAIGGLKEKVLAAHRAGITNIIAPLANKPDWAELPPAARRHLHFTWVDTMDGVVQAVLLPPETQQSVPVHVEAGEETQTETPESVTEIPSQTHPATMPMLRFQACKPQTPFNLQAMTPTMYSPNVQARVVVNAA